MGAALLAERGVVAVGGPDAGPLLQRLVTNDMVGIAPGEARYAALLSPQGKIQCDFLAGVDRDATYWLDCPLELAPELAKKLMLYRLRANVAIADRSDAFGVLAAWPDRPDLPAASRHSFVVRDPRHDSLGWRVIGPKPDLSSLVGPVGSNSYSAHRILLGVPEGGLDFAYAETFPHEANLDRLHGLDFTKGCYVGQEVVSRVEHRGTARKRVVPVMFEGVAPPVGTDILVGHIAIGRMGSGLDGDGNTPGRGIALVRIDRAAEAAAEGAAALANGTHLSIALGALAPGARHA